MEVSKKEILHIAGLANLELDEKEIPEYIKNLQDILNFANIVDKVDLNNVNTTIGITDNYNAFRKDEVKEFEDKDLLLNNSPEMEDGMFKIPKVL